MPNLGEPQCQAVNHVTVNAVAMMRSLESANGSGIWQLLLLGVCHPALSCVAMDAQKEKIFSFGNPFPEKQMYFPWPPLGYQGYP